MIVKKTLCIFSKVKWFSLYEDKRGACKPFRFFFKVNETSSSLTHLQIPNEPI